jgi:hypothetical protein
MLTKSAEELQTISKLKVNAEKTEVVVNPEVNNNKFHFNGKQLF